MRKDEFIAKRIPFNSSIVGNIKMHNLDELPQGSRQIKDINELISYNGRLFKNVVYFLYSEYSNCYYIELTSDDTDLELLTDYIKKGVVYV